MAGSGYDSPMWAVAIAFAAITSGGCGRFSFTEQDLPGDGRGSGIDGDLLPDDGDVDAPRYACVGSEICDSFESGLGVVWMTSTTGVTLDNTRAHRGTNSVRVHTDAFGVGVDS